LITIQGTSIIDNRPSLEKGKEREKEKRKKKKGKQIVMDDCHLFLFLIFFLYSLLIFKKGKKKKNPKKMKPRIHDLPGQHNGGQPLAALGRRWLLLMLLCRSRFTAANLEKKRADACGFWLLYIFCANG
jgi:hypothetical protein